MPLPHSTKLYAALDLQAYRLIQDWAPGFAPAAPATAGAPTLTGPGATGGAASLSYVAYSSNGTDAVASPAGTAAAAQATTPTPTNPVTVGTAGGTPVPAGQVLIIVRTSGTSQGVIGRIGPGQNSLVDKGQPGVPYVASAGAIYGPAIDVPGIKTIAISQTVDNKELRGDYALLATDAVLHDISAACTYAKINLDFDALIMGGSVVDSGVTPNQQAAYSLYGSSRPGVFKLESACVSVDSSANGDCHIVLPKVEISAPATRGFAEENYETFGFSVKAVPRLSDGLWYQELVNETAVVIAA